jgi:hypothetical protein
MIFVWDCAVSTKRVINATMARANFFNGFPHISDEIRQAIGRGCAGAQDFPE